jgi:hypothetical protein
MQAFERITLAVLNSLGDYVVFASPAQIAVAQVSIDHCHLPHHGHSFGTEWHSSHSVGHIGEIFACARHHLCGSRRQGIKAANAAATNRFFIVVSPMFGARSLFERVFSLLRFAPEPELRRSELEPSTNHAVSKSVPD